jgi:hypothetical protein
MFLIRLATLVITIATAMGAEVAVSSNGEAGAGKTKLYDKGVRTRKFTHTHTQRLHVHVLPFPCELSSLKEQGSRIGRRQAHRARVVSQSRSHAICGR